MQVLKNSCVFLGCLFCADHGFYISWNLRNTAFGFNFTGCRLLVLWWDLRYLSFTIYLIWFVDDRIRCANTLTDANAPYFQGFYEPCIWYGNPIYITIRYDMIEVKREGILVFEEENEVKMPQLREWWLRLYISSMSTLMFVSYS